MPKGKQCKACEVVKALTEFYRMKAQNDGLHYYCKECCKQRRRVERVHLRDKKVHISNRQYQRSSREFKHDTQSDPTIRLHLLYKRDKGRCHICGFPVSVKHASIDHVIPLSKLGKHTWSNVALSHVKCNKKKGAKLLS